MSNQTHTPITATNTGGGGILAPVGNHVGRCFSMIDLGTSYDDKFQKSNRKVIIKWELPNATHVFKEGESAKPFSVSKEFTVHMSEKSNLRKALESWRGRPFTEEEVKSFDITKVLGAPCLLNVIAKTSAGGKTYNDITSISPIPKGPDGIPLIPIPDQINPSFVFSLEGFDPVKLESLPDWIKNKIKGSDEYKRLQQPDAISTPSEDPGHIGQEDDLPF